MTAVCSCDLAPAPDPPFWPPTQWDCWCDLAPAPAPTRSTAIPMKNYYEVCLGKATLAWPRLTLDPRSGPANQLRSEQWPPPRSFSTRCPSFQVSSGKAWFGGHRPFGGMCSHWREANPRPGGRGFITSLGGVRRGAGGDSIDTIRAWSGWQGYGELLLYPCSLCCGWQPCVSLFVI
jgi:hypothetical protein